MSKIKIFKKQETEIIGRSQTNSGAEKYTIMSIYQKGSTADLSRQKKESEK